MPFSEVSAKALYKALVDAEEAMNREELKTLQLCQQMPKHAMAAIKSMEYVKALMLQSEAELAWAKVWLFARNEMAVSDPEGLLNEEVAAEMLVEWTRAVDEVTALAEKWKELALRHWDVNLQTANWLFR